MYKVIVEKLKCSPHKMVAAVIQVSAVYSKTIIEMYHDLLITDGV